MNWLNPDTSTLNQSITNMQSNISLVAGILLLLWTIGFINWLLGYRLNYLGIIPRNFFGLIGIATSPFLHGGFNHLFFNSVPLFILAEFMLANGRKNFIQVSAFIILTSGLATWLLGRRAIHIGASSLIMGYWSYLLVDAYYQPSILTIGLAIVCLYYFAGFIFSLFPSQKHVSWEGHLFGFLAGIAASYWFYLPTST